MSVLSASAAVSGACSICIAMKSTVLRCAESSALFHKRSVETIDELLRRDALDMPVENRILFCAAMPPRFRQAGQASCAFFARSVES